MSQIEKDQLLGEILPYVAAQLRTSLGTLHAALPTAGEGASEERNSAIVQQQYYRTMRLVNNLSSAPLLLRQETFLTANVDLPLWLGELTEQARPLCEEAGITLTFTCSELHRTVAIHREYMERLVWNLLSNALKFTPRGGHIGLSLRFVAAQAVIEVSDSGCGISEELMETVFDRYLRPQRTDPAPHGLGLGLPLSRAIAEGHGGRLLLRSQVGQGTTVSVSLPDTKQLHGEARALPFHYAGGFQPVLMELSDALPYTAFYAKHLD